MASSNQQNKTPVPEQNPMERIKNFEEVTQGYTEEMAVSEASRCINCKNRPCMDGCPVNVRIPEFISKITQGEFEQAYALIRSTNSLPAICGRVCPQERQCEARCVRGIKGEPVAIGRLERFAADRHMLLPEENCAGLAVPNQNGRRVAVIGAGPAGLTCAGDLAAEGFAVTIFEALHMPGGVLTYGIPEFRLPKSIVQREIKALEEMGVTIELNTVIGKTMSVDELFDDGFEAVFIGSGAGLPVFLDVPGEELTGVLSANEFLTRINLMKAYKEEYDTPIRAVKRVAVVGGGNVAMDAARCAKRLGAERVYIVYRRGEAEMPARNEEIHHAGEEGIEFIFLAAPTEIKGDSDGNVYALSCIKMVLGEPDASGRRSPVPLENSGFDLDVDTVIVAIGNLPNPLIRTATPGIATNKRGCFVVDEETMSTSREGVYSGGDAVTGAATVILAMGAGKRAARAISDYLKNQEGR